MKIDRQDNGRSYKRRREIKRVTDRYSINASITIKQYNTRDGVLSRGNSLPVCLPDSVRPRIEITRIVF